MERPLLILLSTVVYSAAVEVWFRVTLLAIRQYGIRKSIVAPFWEDKTLEYNGKTLNDM